MIFRRSGGTSGNAEQDYRLGILNTLLRTPHRDMAPNIPIFAGVHERDPLFFGHLAAWYFDKGVVKDLKELFVAFMSVSDFSEEYRDAGLAMLDTLPPYQVERVLGIIKGHKAGDTFVPGIAPAVPRSFKTAVKNYLMKRESDPRAFESAVLHARKSLKTLYASLRIKPGAYAQKVLFENDPSEESRLYALKKIAQAKDPSEQARIILEYKIPYRTAVSVIKHVTPSTLVALVSAMTPQELINNLGSLKRRGAMDNPDLRAMIEGKLEEAKSDKRVSALKSRKALEAAQVDADMAARVEAVGDAQIKSKGRIKRSTALLVDKSGSMETAIEVGKQIAAIVAPICDSDLFVYAFDTLAYPIQARGAELSHWEKAFKGIKADGYTSCGVAIEIMRKNKERVEQILMVTDQGENSQPFMVNAYDSYVKELNVAPDVIIVNVGQHAPTLEKALAQAGVGVDTFTFDGDYYSLPNLIPLLIGGTRLDLLLEILAYPLPERRQPVGAAR